MLKYRLISKKGEGTFSEVLKAQSIKTNRYVAIKCMKNKFDSVEQVNNLREIQALRRLSPHQHIIKLYEVVYDQASGRLALVFELMDMNMYEAIRGRRQFIQESKVKFYMYQLLKAMDHMHRNGIFHRDIKPENILMVNDVIKLADFGSCRGIYSKQPYTEYISTRWYRAPECLLTDGYYNYKMDIWGVGCVFFEIMTLFPLFPGANEMDQIQRIHSVMGTPPADLLEKFKSQASHIDFNFTPTKGTGIARHLGHASPECVELIQMLLAYNPDERLSARQALKHPYFKDLREAEKAAVIPKQLGAVDDEVSHGTPSNINGNSSSNNIHNSDQQHKDNSMSSSSQPQVVKSHLNQNNNSALLPPIKANNDGLSRGQNNASTSNLNNNNVQSSTHHELLSAASSQQPNNNHQSSQNNSNVNLNKKSGYSSNRKQSANSSSKIPSRESKIPPPEYSTNANNAVLPPILGPASAGPPLNSSNISSSAAKKNGLLMHPQQQKMRKNSLSGTQQSWNNAQHQQQQSNSVGNDMETPSSIAKSVRSTVIKTKASNAL